MSPMTVPSQYTPLPVEALKIGRAVSAEKAAALAGAGAWLYEAYLDQPVPGRSSLSNRIRFDHTGEGRGRPLPVVQHLRRGLFLSGEALDAGVRIEGEGRDRLVPQVHPGFQFGSVPPDGGTFNTIRWPLTPFLPHPYGVVLRALFLARRASGSGVATLRAAVYSDPRGERLLALGDPVTVEEFVYQRIELSVDLRERRVSVPFPPGGMWTWGVLAYAPVGSSFDLLDRDTGPSLALCSV